MHVASYAFSSNCALEAKLFSAGRWGGGGGGGGGRRADLREFRDAANASISDSVLELPDWTITRNLWKRPYAAEPAQ